MKGSIGKLNEYVPEKYIVHLVISHLKQNFTGQLSVPITRNTHRLQENDSAHEADLKFAIKLHSNRIVITKAILLANNSEKTLKVNYNRESQEVELTSTETFCGNTELDKAILRIDYVGSIKNVQTFGDTTEGIFRTNYSDSISGEKDRCVIATHNQPYGCRSIFPLIDEPQFKVPIKLSVKTAGRFKAISNTCLTSCKQRVDAGAEDRVFEFKETPPIAPSVFGFVVGDLEYLEDKVGDVPIRVYGIPRELDGCRYPLKIATQLLPNLESIFRTKYPLDKLDFVSLPFLSDGALENWGMITLLAPHFLTEEDASSSDKLKLRQLVAHEMVHQWVGNLVTFDGWDLLWFNEAFATVFGNYLLKLAKFEPQGCADGAFEFSHLEGIESLMNKDCWFGDRIPFPSINDYITTLYSGVGATTTSMFEIVSYEKGMLLIVMIGNFLEHCKQFDGKANGIDFSNFLACIAEFIHKYRYKTARISDLWKICDDFSGLSISHAVEEWLRKRGYPILEVTAMHGKIGISQRPFDLQPIHVDDQGYVIPLTLTKKEGEGKTRKEAFMFEKNTTLELSKSEFVSLNVNKTGYYRLSFSQEVVQGIIDNIVHNLMEPVDIISLINDYSSILMLKSANSKHLLVVLQLLSCFETAEWRLNYRVLRSILKLLEYINEILLRFSGYFEFRGWLNSFIRNLFYKVGRWDNFLNLKAQYDPIEMEVRNAILQLGGGIKETQDLSFKIFRNLINPGKKKYVVAKEIMPSVFNLVMSKASQKEYKQIMHLAKNSDSLILNNTDACALDVQRSALSSLSFSNSTDLLARTLNFVLANLESRLIGLALTGFRYKSSKENKLQLWTWYCQNFDRIALKALEKDAQGCKQLPLSLEQISKLVLGDIMQHDKSLIEMRNDFISSKLKHRQEYDLSSLMQNIVNDNEQKTKIGGFYDDITSWLKQ